MFSQGNFPVLDLELALSITFVYYLILFPFSTAAVIYRDSCTFQLPVRMSAYNVTGLRRSRRHKTRLKLDSIETHDK